MSSSPLVWLITGTSSGIGRDLAEAALRRGDKVIATARAKSFHQLDGLKAKGAEAVELDVTAPREVIDEAAKKAVRIYGHVDILVNNAGYVLTGSLEEQTEQETLDQFNTNVFGAITVARAFLPYMRKRKTGTLIWIGSLGGWSGMANVALYCATKWTLRGISEGLHQEISPFGLRSICVDFGYFRTPLLNDGHRTGQISRIPEYQAVLDQNEKVLQAANNNQPGDPKKAAQVLVDLAHGTGGFAGREFQTSLVLGSDAYQVAKQVSEDAIRRLDEWKDVSLSTDHDDI